MTTPRRKKHDKNTVERNKRARPVYVDVELQKHLRCRVRPTDGVSGLMRRSLHRYFALMDQTLAKMEFSREVATEMATHLYDAWLAGKLDPETWTKEVIQHSGGNLSLFVPSVAKRWDMAQRFAALDFLERVWMQGPRVLLERPE